MAQGKNRQPQANVECVDCGYTENADVVGGDERMSSWTTVGEPAELGSGLNNIRAKHARRVYEVNFNREQS